MSDICFHNKMLIEQKRKTLLWEYDFEFNEELFQNISLFYEELNKSGYECKCLLKTFYLYNLGLAYKEGSLWGNSSLLRNDQSLQDDFFSCLVEVLEKYRLFYPSIKEGHYKVNLILIHAVLPKYYAQDFLTIVSKIYEELDDIDFFYKYSKEKLQEAFRYSLKHFRGLIQNDETLPIFKDLIYRTAKTLELVGSGREINRYGLPSWFVEEIKRFRKEQSFQVKKRDYIFFEKGSVKASFGNFEHDVYFFDEDRYLIEFEAQEQIIYLSKEPKYIVLNKELEEWVEEIEEDFSSGRRWEDEEGNYYCYELIDDIIDEEIAGYFFKRETLTRNIDIKLTSIKNIFPSYLKSLDGSEAFFDGFKIENFQEFYKVYVVKDGMETLLEKEMFRETGSFTLRAVSSLGKSAKDKRVTIVPYVDVMLEDDQVFVGNKTYSMDEIVEIGGVKFKVNKVDIFATEKISGKSTDVLLFKKLEKYEIRVKQLPFKRAKIEYVDSDNKVINRVRLRGNKKTYKVSLERDEKEIKFPVKAYFVANKEKRLLFTIYKTDVIDNFIDAIEIEPKFERLSVVIQSREDIFAAPLKMNNQSKIYYKDFPEPKRGDFDVIIYDKHLGKKITPKKVTIGKFETDDEIVRYFRMPNVFSPPIIKENRVKDILYRLQKIHYHFFDEDIQYKLEIFLKKFYKSHKKIIDSFIQNRDNIVLLKYLILFSKKFEIINMPLNKVLKEEILLAIKVRFTEEIQTIHEEEIVKEFFRLLNTNDFTDIHRKSLIFEILDFYEIQDIIKKSHIRIIDGA